MIRLTYVARRLATDCTCHRSAVFCDRVAVRAGLCRVCVKGCGELRFGAPSDDFIMMKLIAAHEPMIMDYNTRMALDAQAAATATPTSRASGGARVSPIIRDSVGTSAFRTLRRARASKAAPGR